MRRARTASPTASSPGTDHTRADTLAAAILVEGRSDERAVAATAALLGHDLAAAGVAVIPVGGAMAIRRAVAEHGRGGAGLRLVGLVDAGEVRHACRALFGGADVEPYPGALGDAGFFVCDPDLEHELISALGVSGVEAVLAGHGDLDRFRRFQHQPSHRDEPVTTQLHRFLGTTAGRKIAYGGTSWRLSPRATSQPRCAPPSSARYG